MSLAYDFGRHKGRVDALKEFLKTSPDNLRKSLARDLLDKERPIAQAVLKRFMSTPTAQDLGAYHEGYDFGWKETFNVINNL